MNRLVGIFIIVILMLLGFVLKLISIASLNKRLQYTVDYRNDFIDFCNELEKTGSIGGEKYYRLLKEVNKIQRELGMDGIISVYRDPLAGFQMNNYPVFLNFFNELRTYSTDFSLFGERRYLLVSNADESLTKHIGVLNDAIDIAKQRLKNPVYCFANGINGIISLPIKILEWSGILTNDFSSRILKSKVHQIISKLLVLIGLISSIMTIVMGWNQFLDLIRNIIEH